MYRLNYFCFKSNRCYAGHHDHYKKHWELRYDPLTECCEKYGISGNKESSLAITSNHNDFDMKTRIFITTEKKECFKILRGENKNVDKCFFHCLPYKGRTVSKNSLDLNYFLILIFQIFHKRLALTIVNLQKKCFIVLR